MKSKILIQTVSLLGILLSPLAWGADKPASTTQPASTATSSTSTTATGTVLLLPFESVGSAPMPWAAEAMQQNLLAELARPRGVRPIVLETVSPQPITPERAVALGRQVGAAYVIFGSYQVVGVELRFTGQVLEVSTGQYQGALKATGATRDLFALEDELARQARTILPAPAPPSAAVAKAPAVTIPQVPQLAPPAIPNVQGPPDTYDGSDLQRAVQSGRLHITPPPEYYDDNYYNRSYWYTYSRPFYGYPYYATPYYYRPCVSYAPQCYRPVSCAVPAVSIRFIAGRGYGHTQGYVPMTVRSLPTSYATAIRR